MLTQSVGHSGAGFRGGPLPKPLLGHPLKPLTPVDEELADRGYVGPAAIRIRHFVDQIEAGLTARYNLIKHPVPKRFTTWLRCVVKALHDVRATGGEAAGKMVPGAIERRRHTLPNRRRRRRSDAFIYGRNFRGHDSRPGAAIVADGRDMCRLAKLSADRLLAQRGVHAARRRREHLKATC
jgi:hypothetical protein